MPRPPFVRLVPASEVAEQSLPPHAKSYPEFRYMGSKHRLLPWLHGVLAKLDFRTAEDPFVGSGSVGYLLKSMGKSVRMSDFLNFPTVIASALVANSRETVSQLDLEKVLRRPEKRNDFIERTFTGIFFTPEELRFLDDVWANLSSIRGEARRSLILTSLIRSCMKRQPRGVFTVRNHSDGAARYDDGRRDIRTSLREHFVEQVELLNALVFDNGEDHSAEKRDVFAPSDRIPDLVYLDPPYVPRADDNCYMKRYHFLEGLSCYWRGVLILESSKVKKIAKPHTPFSYRKEAEDAFQRLFARYARSTIVMSYSSNGYPDQAALGEILGHYKKSVTVHERQHRYHFGTHAGVERAETTEYVLVGTDS